MPAKIISTQELTKNAGPADTSLKKLPITFTPVAESYRPARPRAMSRLGARSCTKMERMYCPGCGSQIEGSPCSVCGTVFGAATSQMFTVSGRAYAGWWRRAGATLVDNLILFIPTLLVVAVVSSVTDSVVGALAGVAVQGVYMVKLLAAPRGQTFGNRAAASVVRDASSGQAISTPQALRRWGFIAVYSAFALANSSGATLLVGLLGLVDCLYPLFNARKQTLHDLFAGTVVLKI